MSDHYYYFSNLGSRVHFPQGLDYPPNELRYLNPLKMLSSNFSAENLIELNLLTIKLNNSGKEKMYDS